jgi:hypothetical protein
MQPVPVPPLPAAGVHPMADPPGPGPEMLNEELTPAVSTVPVNSSVHLVSLQAGAPLAAAIFHLFKDAHTLTAKLFDDVQYASTMAAELPTTGRLPRPPYETGRR